MSTTKIRTAAVALAIVGAFALTSCSSSSTEVTAQPTSTTSATTAPTDAPAAETAPATPAAPAIGATVTTPEEIEAAKAAGLGVYKSVSGAQVVIDPAAPVAQVVVEDAKATGAGAGPAASKADVGVRMDALKSIAYASADSGKKLVFIIYRTDTGKSGEVVGSGISFATLYPELQTGTQGKMNSVAEATAAAQARISTMADPSAYEIVNLVG